MAEGALQRQEGVPPIEGVPKGAVILVEHRGNWGSLFSVLTWNPPMDDDAPRLRNWETEEGIGENMSDVVAHYRVFPPNWGLS